MSTAEDSVDWRKLREFADTDLEQSFLLSCEMESSTLLIDVDLYLEAGHPFEKPRPAQKVCIRPAVIEFPYCDSISLDGSAGEAGPAAVAAKVGHGAINGLQLVVDGRYELKGEFGVVLIDAERPILRLKGP